jgi:hypothetical protein
MYFRVSAAEDQIPENTYLCKHFVGYFLVNPFRHIFSILKRQNYFFNKANRFKAMK